MSIGVWPAFLDDADATPACRGEDTNKFFPEAGDTGYEAKVICGGCPLLIRCRDWALNQPLNDVYGIWGGLSDSDRLRLRRVRGAAAQPVRQRQRSGPGDHHDVIVEMLARQPEPATWAEIADAIGYSVDAVKAYWQRQKQAVAAAA